MDELDFFEEQQELGVSAEETMRLRVAFGDNVAQRYLALRGVVGERAQEAVLERHASRQAERLARVVIAQACSQPQT
ncbi:hypothetical protein KY495_22160 [Massilia sp. PAMC28688]|uniref:hypothetical protein n=1 Tax=Massilia sp. PAMC28688 TaxID=2861283 RepID=UPI001C63B390|nr:hypothetical protein [Massilia sp. PAMC28688]QYF93344.1 hypothetical protein KY495_22160 [Massilia sp. PAMC28688]